MLNEGEYGNDGDDSNDTLIVEATGDSNNRCGVDGEKNDRCGGGVDRTNGKCGDDGDELLIAHDLHAWNELITVASRHFVPPIT